jgi:hypothetical protein
MDLTRRSSDRRYNKHTQNFSRNVQTESGAHPSSYRMGTGVKWPRSEANYLSPSSAKVKNAWIYTSTPPYVCMAWCLSKYREKFNVLPLSSRK